MPTFTVTCHTEGCANGGIPISLEYDPASPPQAVVCGVCGKPITDITTGS